MTEERKQQANILLNEITNNIISQQRIALSKNDKKEYELKLNKVEGEFVREKELLDDIKAYVGHDANIIVTYVDEIPLLSSGKRKQVVNNYKKL